MSYQIEQTILLRDYLKKLPISQAMIKRIKREGDFLVNGKSQTVRCLLQKGDCLEIIFPIENSNIQPENIPLKIIYEDDYYIIIDKESQMPCIPTKRYQSHTLCHALMYYYQQMKLLSHHFHLSTCKFHLNIFLLNALCLTLNLNTFYQQS